MMKKYIVITMIIALFIQGCSSLIFDQKKVSDMEKDLEASMNNLKGDYAPAQEKKEYETNRIISNDFPVTYRAKSKGGF